MTVSIGSCIFRGVKRVFALLVVGASFWWGTQPLHALFIIDSFDTTQYISVSGTPSGYKTNFSSVVALDVVGQSRDVFIERTTSNAGSVAFDASASTNGFASFAQGLNTAGRALVVWDGPDTTTNIIYNGLGKVDVTQGGTNQWLFTKFGSDLGNVSIKFTFYTDSTNFSFTTVNVPSNSLINLASVHVPLGNFSVGGGSGADFTKIGAVSMLIDGTTKNDADLIIDAVELVWVPEPSSAVLGMLGAWALALVRRRRR